MDAGGLAVMPVDREILEQHLAQAEEHVRRGAEHLASQRAIIAELERDGHDTKVARGLLATYEEMQAMHIADRDRAAARLAAASRNSTSDD